MTTAPRGPAGAAAPRRAGSARRRPKKAQRRSGRESRLARELGQELPHGRRQVGHRDPLRASHAASRAGLAISAGSGTQSAAPRYSGVNMSRCSGSCARPGEHAEAVRSSGRTLAPARAGSATAAVPAEDPLGHAGRAGGEGDVGEVVRPSATAEGSPAGSAARHRRRTTRGSTIAGRPPDPAGSGRPPRAVTRHAAPARRSMRPGAPPDRRDRGSGRPRPP